MQKRGQLAKIKKFAANDNVRGYVVRPAGLEPATFWFVAKHSIRLSYERTWRRARDSNPRYRFWPVYSLSRRAPSTDSANSPKYSGWVVSGGGGGIRTHGTLSGSTVFKTVTFNRSDTPPIRDLSYDDYNSISSYQCQWDLLLS